MHGLAATRTAFPVSRTHSWYERILALAAGSHARASLLLVLLGLVCFVPGLASLQPMDRDEPRFAQASKQMVETGDYVDIRFQDEPRYKKPIGIHWLQAATVTSAEAMGLTARIAIRVNPDFELKSSGMRMGGGPKPFGIDAETLPELLPTIVAPLVFEGFHLLLADGRQQGRQVAIDVPSIDVRAMLDEHLEHIDLASIAKCEDCLLQRTQSPLV